MCTVSVVIMCYSSTALIVYWLYGCVYGCDGYSGCTGCDGCISCTGYGGCDGCNGLMVVIVVMKLYWL